jgi:FMN-dependent NADH-azoreductase
MQLLQVDSSPLGGQSVSRKLTQEITARWLAAHPGTTVQKLDLAAQAPAHLDPQGAQAAQEAEVTEALLSQFLAADVVVLGAPMYNFSIPSQLKAWIDRLAQPGRTFRYTEKGPQGLAGGKTVIVASSRGGIYSGNPALAAMEHQESYLQAVFAFFGVTDVRVVRAEGLAMGDEARQRALAAAEQDIRRHIDTPAALQPA